MSSRKRPSTTKLPQALLDEISQQNEPNGSSRRRKNAGHSDRKTERKAERQRAKQRKAQFFAQGHPHHNQNASNKRSIEDFNEANGPRNVPRKKRKFEVGKSENMDSKQSVPTAKRGEEKKEATVKKPKEKKKESVPASKESKKLKKKEKESLDWDPTAGHSRQDEEEDAYIMMLERKLGVDKKKKGKSKYGSGFEDDGLLDLLVDLDEKLPGEEDDELESGNDELEMENSEDESDMDSLEEPGTEEEVSDNEDADIQKDEEEIGEDDWGGFDDSGSSGEEEQEEVNKSENPAPGTRYVPPQLRKQLQDSHETDIKLARTLKGLLNRLSEQNIDSILKEIEELYRKHKRHDITSTLTNLVIEGTCLHSILLDSYVALHAGLIACLHKIIGIEIAAYFVQSVVSNFERHYERSKEEAGTPEEVQSPDGEEKEVGKECSNLLVLLSDLYNYRVISCTLVYDIIRLILEGHLSELDVELILKLAKGSGTQLRQDDPSALKDIIQIIQSKLGDQRSTSSRTRFMVETLNNLKNNKIRKGTDSQGGGESKDRISKFVSGIGKKYHVHANEPLRISLDDLHQADTKGKWWLVGAAWGGDPLVDRMAEPIPETKETDNTLLKLAKKQGMNTDVRRSVFVVLMSSDDYVDACDRLTQLNLTEVQQREIIRVLLHCCGNEKSYNPYYALIGQNMCRQTHSHRVTLQFCFWDFLRSLGETGIGGADMAQSNEYDQEEDQGFELDRISSTRSANVARAFAWWISRDCISITILKTLDFISLKKKTTSFLLQFFTQLFLCTQDPSLVLGLDSNVPDTVLKRRDEKTLSGVIVKAARIPALARGIVYFMAKVFGDVQPEDSMGEFITWCCEVSREALETALESGQFQQQD